MAPTTPTGTHSTRDVLCKFISPLSRYSGTRHRGPSEGADPPSPHLSQGGGLRTAAVLLALRLRPAQLLERDGDLADHRVDHRLPRLAAGDGGDRVGVLDDAPLHHAQQLPPLREGRRRPLPLRVARGAQKRADVPRPHLRHLAEEVHRGGVPARHPPRGRRGGPAPAPRKLSAAGRRKLSAASRAPDHLISFPVNPSISYRSFGFFPSQPIKCFIYAMMP
eukprot:gene4318-biopygen3162